jgi:hypothetical protein
MDAPFDERLSHHEGHEDRITERASNLKNMVSFFVLFVSFVVKVLVRFWLQPSRARSFMVKKFITTKSTKVTKFLIHYAEAPRAQLFFIARIFSVISTKISPCPSLEKRGKHSLYQRKFPLCKRGIKGDLKRS